MAGRLQLADQPLLIEAFAAKPGGLRDAIGVIEHHIARLQHDLLDAVVSLALQADQQAGGIETIHLVAPPPPDQGGIVGRIGEAQPAGFGVVIGIEEGDETVRMGQVFLGQLVEIVKDPFRGVAAQHLRPQHAPQQGHQQARGHPLAHHISHHQGPAGLLTALALQLGAGGDEVVVVTTHLEGGPAAGGQLDSVDHGAVIGQQLGLDLRARTELAIEALMAPHGLLQGIIFQGHGAEIGHQLQVASMHLTPGKALAPTKDIKPPPLHAAGHHRGGKHLATAQQAAYPLVEQGQLPIPEGCQLTHQLGTAIPRRCLELLAPDAAIFVKHHQHGPLCLHQPGCHQGHQLQEAAQVGEAAQGEGQGGEQLLIAALLPAEAVE